MERLSESAVDSAEPVEDVHLKILAAGENANIQHFTIAPGATVPQHSHPHEQLGYIINGTITFILDGGTEMTLEAGDSYSLAGHEVHGVENRGDEPVEGVDIFSPPRTDPDWAE